MTNLKTSPTGKLISGHVLDSCPKYVAEALRSYDPQLYVRWDAKRLHGWGCWTVRWKPELKTVKHSQVHEYLPNGKMKFGVQGDVYDFEGFTLVYPKYHEIDFNNHVMDVPFLNYSVLEKIKKMDMWTKDELGYKGKNLTSTLHYNEAKHDEKLEDKMVNDLEYNLKQHKSEIRWFKDHINSGGNPYRLADYWGK